MNTPAASLWRLTATLVGNSLLRIGSGAGGVLVGLYLADQSANGLAGGAVLAGTLGAVSFSTELAGSIPMGLISDALAPRVLMTLGGILGAIGTQVFGVAARTEALFAGRSIEGLGAAASAPAILAHLSGVTRHSSTLRSRVMSYFELTLLGGLAVGGLAGAGLWRWQGRGAFTSVAGLYLAAAALLCWGGAGSRGDGAASAWAGFRSALRSPPLRRLAPVWICANALVGLWLGPTVPFLLVQPTASGQFLSGVFQAEPHRVGWVTFAFAMIFGTGITAWSFILPRVDMFKAMRTALLGMLGVCLGLYFLNHSGPGENTWRWILGILSSLCVMVESGFTPAALSMLAGVVGAQTGRGAAMGIYSVLLSLGSILGSLMAGWLGDRYAMDGILAGTAAVGVVAMLMLIRMERRETRAT